MAGALDAADVCAFRYSQCLPSVLEARLEAANEGAIGSRNTTPLVAVAMPEKAYSEAVHETKYKAINPKLLCHKRHFNDGKCAERL